MTQTDRVYSSNRNGDTAHEYINIDMIKLLMDKIAFVRGELSQDQIKKQSKSRQNRTRIIKLIRENATNFSTIIKTSPLVIKIVKKKCTQSDPPNSFTKQALKQARS